jgi:putative membrane protein
VTEMATSTYCGPAAVPGELAQHWNLDPVVIAALGCIALLHAFGARRGAQAVGLRHHLLFAAALLVAGAIVLSPLCSLGVALFSARVGGHVLLVLLVAPLLVVGGRPSMPHALPSCAAFARRLPRDRSGALRSLVFAATFWGWHAPGPYAATFASDAAYWSMQLSLLASALWLWSGLLRREPEGRIASLAGAATTMTQLGFLGALLTFSPTPLYAQHLASAPAWGLSALDDQQIGGLICWVPGCGVLLSMILVNTASWLRDDLEDAR